MIQPFYSPLLGSLMELKKAMGVEVAAVTEGAGEELKSLGAGRMEVVVEAVAAWVALVAD